MTFFPLLSFQHPFAVGCCCGLPLLFYLPICLDSFFFVLLVFVFISIYAPYSGISRLFMPCFYCRFLSKLIVHFIKDKKTQVKVNCNNYYMIDDKK